MLLRRGPDGRQTVTSGPEASAVQCVDGVRRVLEDFAVDANMFPILLSVVPRLHLTAEAL